MFDFTTAELTAWLAAHEQWILVSIAAMAFLESLAIVGIIVPGVAFLFAIAVAAGSVHLSLSSVLIAGFIGAVLGDGISFFLGRHYHHIIRKLPPFSSHPEWITKGERFFERYGLISVVIGRFVGPIRPVMPLIAGMLEMRPSHFLTINAISAIGWAPMYLLPGYLVGSAAESTTLSQQHFVFIISALLGGWLCAQIIWWLKSLTPSRALKIKINSVFFITSLALIVALFWWQGTPWFQNLNQQTALWFLSLRHPDMDIFFIGLTALGNFNPMLLWGTAVFLALMIGKNYYLAGLWFTTTLIANGLMQGMKYFFSIDRPQLIFDPPTSFAYPSGHTSMVVVFFFLIFLFALPAMNFRWQKPAVSLAAIIATLMALSRLYLGVHWLSDIIGGLLLAGFVASGVLMVLFYKPFVAPNPKPILYACTIALILNLGLWVIPHWAQLIESHQPIYSVL